MYRTISSSLIVTLLTTPTSALHTNATWFSNDSRPLVLCHRGTTGRFPEESLGSFTDCFYENADFAEMDLQLTKDGYLIVNHDPSMKAATDIELYEWKYADRKKSISIGAPYYSEYDDDWFWKDFTLAEIKQLKRKQEWHMRSTVTNYEFQVLTLREVIEHYLMLNVDQPRAKEFNTGLYIETKQWGWYKEQTGADTAEKLNDLLSEYGLNSVEGATGKMPIIIECFEKDALIRSSELNDLPRVQLAYGPLQNYTDIATYAHAIGPDLASIYASLSDDPTVESGMVKDAHDAGLEIHGWTARDDMLQFTNNPVAEDKLYFDWKIDGVFTEYPHEAMITFNYFASKESGAQGLGVRETI